MKKVFGILGILIYCSFLFGKNIRFDIIPKYNLQNGVLNEYVFQKLSDNPRYKLSELNWEVTNSSSLGLETTLGLYFLDFSFYFAQIIPSSFGHMFDSDWQSSNFDQSLKTNFSQSINNIETGYDLTLKMAAHITPIYWLTVKPFLSCSYNCFNLASSNAFGGYGDTSSTGLSHAVAWDDPLAKKYSVGDLCSIDYNRTTLNIYIGFDIDFYIYNLVKILTSFGAAPYNKIDSLDIHWSNHAKTAGTMYNDRFEGNFNYFYGSLAIEVKAIEKIFVGIQGNFTYMNLIYGNTYSKDVIANKYPKKPEKSSYAGCSGYLYTISVYTAIRL